MGNLEGLRVLAALEIAELSKKGISFVTKGVIQVQEAWYGQAMEVAYAANNYSIGPSEVMEVKQAVNSYFRESSEGDTRVKTCRQSSRGCIPVSFHLPWTAWSLCISGSTLSICSHSDLS